MRNILMLTFKGILRDRVYQGILVAALLFAVIPAVTSLSMRQVTELSITLSLSLISFILLLLAVFVGATSVWKDIERRYTFSVLGLPLSRGMYISGKFAGVALFLLLTGIVLGLAAVVVIYLSSHIYPPERPVMWNNLLIAILFDCLKYIFLTAVAFFLSTVSTSFFLPVFGTIATFMGGSALQQVYDYVNSSSGRDFTPFLKQAVTVLYYVLPNFSAFDFKLNAIYSIKIPPSGIFLTFSYFMIYTSVILSLSALVFSRREMK